MPNSSNAMFVIAGLGRMRKAYCKCGRIISFDSGLMNTKLALGKELECPCCRMARISKDIDEINASFDGAPSEDLY